MKLRDLAAVGAEFGGWLAKRVAATAMGWDREIDMLRRRVGSDPTDREALARLKILENRAGHEEHIVADKRFVRTISEQRFAFEIEGFDARCYVPASLSIETVGQIAVRGVDYGFDDMLGRVVWLILPGLDQEIVLTWQQWEPKDQADEGNTGQPNPLASFESEPWE